MRKLVVKEPRREIRMIELKRTRTLIGRAIGSDVQLESMLASRMHALLSVVDEGVFLSDLDSANGTYVNGDRVAKARLRNRDRIRVGECEISFLEDDMGPQPSSQPQSNVVAMAP